MWTIHMKLALIGVGQAGGKVVDEFLAYDARTGADIVRGAIAEELTVGGEFRTLCIN